MFNTNKETLTASEVSKYIQVFKTKQLVRLKKLKRYFDNKNDTILNRTFNDITKPNNKVCSPWASYISNTLTGYFMGSPVVYSSTNKELYDDIITVLKDNDEEVKNYQLALDMSIYGVAYELNYIVNGEFRFDMINPQTMITIYDNSISQELKFAIRFWTEQELLTDKEVTYAVVYDNKYATTFKGTLGESFTQIDKEEHMIGKIPVIVYKNTKGYVGDFEKIISLIDSYDIAIADTMNFREELNDNYLVFKNTNLENEDIIKMKNSKIIQIENGAEGVVAEVEWLTRESNDGESENLKSRLETDIKTFSYISELEVKSHTTASGNSLQLIGLESLIAQKEQNFRKALNKRLDNIIEFINMLGEDYTNDITMKFTRNLPLDMNIEADILSKVAPYVTHETLLGLMSFIPNPKAESDKWKLEQKENNINNQNNIDNQNNDIDKQNNDIESEVLDDK